MTIRIPPPNLLDKLLNCLGKERHIILPEGMSDEMRKRGPYIQVKAKRESFLKALFGGERKKPN